MRKRTFNPAKDNPITFATCLLLEYYAGFPFELTANLSANQLSKFVFDVFPLDENPIWQSGHNVGYQEGSIFGT